MERVTCSYLAKAGRLECPVSTLTSTLASNIGLLSLRSPMPSNLTLNSTCFAAWTASPAISEMWCNASDVNKVDECVGQQRAVINEGVVRVKVGQVHALNCSVKKFVLRVRAEQEDAEEARL